MKDDKMHKSALRFSNVGLELPNGFIENGTIIFLEEHVWFKCMKTESEDVRIQSSSINDVTWLPRPIAGSIGIRIVSKHSIIHRFSGFQGTDKALIANFFFAKYSHPIVERPIVNDRLTGHGQRRISHDGVNGQARPQRQMPASHSRAVNERGNRSMDNACANGHDHLPPNYHYDERTSDFRGPIAVFSAVKGSVPRCHYEFEIFKSHLQLTGDTKLPFAPKIPISSITQLIRVPQNDGQNTYFVIGLNPSLKRGKTAYPYLVFSFVTREKQKIELKMSKEELKRRFDDRLKKSEVGFTHEAISNLIHLLTKCKIKISKPISSFRKILSSSDDKRVSCIDCYYKNGQGIFTFLTDGVIFLHTPPLFVSYGNIREFEIDADSSTATRNCDLRINRFSGLPVEFKQIPKRMIPEISAFIIDHELPIHGGKEKFIPAIKLFRDSCNQQRKECGRKRKGRSESESDSGSDSDSDFKAKSKRPRTDKKSFRRRSQSTSSSSDDSDNKHPAGKPFISYTPPSSDLSSGDEGGSGSDSGSGANSDDSDGHNSDGSLYSYVDPITNECFSKSYTRNAQPVVLLSRLREEDEHVFDDAHDNVDTVENVDLESDSNTSFRSVTSDKSSKRQNIQKRDKRSPEPERCKPKSKHNNDKDNSKDRVLSKLPKTKRIYRIISSSESDSDVDSVKNSNYHSRDFPNSPQSPPRPSTSKSSRSHSHSKSKSETVKSLFHDPSHISNRKSEKGKEKIDKNSGSKARSSSSKNNKRDISPLKSETENKRIAVGVEVGDPDNDKRLVALRKKQKETKKDPKLTTKLSAGTVPLPGVLPPIIASQSPPRPKSKSRHKSSGKKPKDIEVERQKDREIEIVEMTELSDSEIIQNRNSPNAKFPVPSPMPITDVSPQISDVEEIQTENCALSSDEERSLPKNNSTLDSGPPLALPNIRIKHEVDGHGKKSSKNKHKQIEVVELSDSETAPDANCSDFEIPAPPSLTNSPPRFSDINEIDLTTPPPSPLPLPNRNVSVSEAAYQLTSEQVESELENNLPSGSLLVLPNIRIKNEGDRPKKSKSKSHKKKKKKKKRKRETEVIDLSPPASPPPQLEPEALESVKRAVLFPSTDVRIKQEVGVPIKSESKSPKKRKKRRKIEVIDISPPASPPPSEMANNFNLQSVKVENHNYVTSGISYSTPSSFLPPVSASSSSPLFFPNVRIKQDVSSPPPSPSQALLTPAADLVEPSLQAPIEQEINVRIKVDPDDPGDILAIQVDSNPVTHNVQAPLMPIPLPTVPIKREVVSESNYEAAEPQGSLPAEEESTSQLHGHSVLGTDTSTATPALVSPTPTIKIEHDTEEVEPSIDEPIEAPPLGPVPAPRVKVDHDRVEVSNAERMRWIQNQPQAPPPPAIRPVKQEPGAEQQLRHRSQSQETPQQVQADPPADFEAATALVEVQTLAPAPSPAPVPVSVPITLNPFPNLTANLNLPPRVHPPSRPLQSNSNSPNSNMVPKPSKEAQMLRFKQMVNQNANQFISGLGLAPPKNSRSSSKHSMITHPRSRELSRAPEWDPSDFSPHDERHATSTYFWYRPKRINRSAVGGPNFVTYGERVQYYVELSNSDLTENQNQDRHESLAPRIVSTSDIGVRYSSNESSRSVRPRSPPADVNRTNLAASVAFENIGGPSQGSHYIEQPNMSGSSNSNPNSHSVAPGSSNQNQNERESGRSSVESREQQFPHVAAWVPAPQNPGPVPQAETTNSSGKVVHRTDSQDNDRNNTNLPPNSLSDPRRNYNRGRGRGRGQNRHPTPAERRPNSNQHSSFNFHADSSNKGILIPAGKTNPKGTSNSNNNNSMHRNYMEKERRNSNSGSINDLVGAQPTPYQQRRPSHPPPNSNPHGPENQSKVGEKVQITILNEKFRGPPSGPSQGLDNLVFKISNDKFQENTNRNAQPPRPQAAATATSATSTSTGPQPGLLPMPTPRTTSSSSSQRSPQLVPTGIKQELQPDMHKGTLVAKKPKHSTPTNPYGLRISERSGYPTGTGPINLECGKSFTFPINFDAARNRKICSSDAHGNIFYPIGPCLNIMEPCVVCSSCRSLGHTVNQCPIIAMQDPRHPAGIAPPPPSVHYAERGQGPSWRPPLPSQPPPRRPPPPAPPPPSLMEVNVHPDANVNYQQQQQGFNPFQEAFNWSLGMPPNNPPDQYYGNGNGNYWGNPGNYYGGNNGPGPGPYGF